MLPVRGHQSQRTSNERARREGPEGISAGRLTSGVLRSTLYRLFARLLALPAPQEKEKEGESDLRLSVGSDELALFAEVLFNPEDDAAEAYSGLRASLPGLIAEFRQREDLPEKYWEAFESPLPERVPLVESYYRVWTEDPGCESPIAKKRGFLLSDHALHMERLLELAGWSLPVPFAVRPDHLVVELEFMALLCEEAPLEVQAQFFRDHLTWVGKAADLAREGEIDDLYRRILDYLVLFLQEEERELLVVKESPKDGSICS